MDRAVKKEIKDEYKQHEHDTGSVEVQVALLTERIKEITAHLQTHRKDHASRRGLLMIVNKRRKLLRYLQENDNERYKKLIQRLGLRK